MNASIEYLGGKISDLRKNEDWIAFLRIYLIAFENNHSELLVYAVEILTKKSSIDEPLVDWLKITAKNPLLAGAKAINLQTKLEGKDDHVVQTLHSLGHFFICVCPENFSPPASNADIKKSIEFLEKLTEVKNSDPYANIALKKAIGEGFLKIKLYDKGQELLEEALSLLNKIGRLPETVSIRGRLNLLIGKNLVAHREYDLSKRHLRSYFASSLVLWRADTSYWGWCYDALFCLAYAHDSNGEHREAVVLSYKAKEFLDKFDPDWKNNKAHYKYLNNFSSQLFSLGEYEKALAYFNDLKNISSKDLVYSRYVDARIATTLWHLGGGKELEILLNRLTSTTPSNINACTEIHILQTHGSMLRWRKDYKGAIESFNKAEFIYQNLLEDNETFDPLEYMQIRLERGVCLVSSGSTSSGSKEISDTYKLGFQFLKEAPQNIEILFDFLQNGYEYASVVEDCGELFLYLEILENLVSAVDLFSNNVEQEDLLKLATCVSEIAISFSRHSRFDDAWSIWLKSINILSRYKKKEDNNFVLSEFDIWIKGFELNLHLKVFSNIDLCKEKIEKLLIQFEKKQDALKKGKLVFRMLCCYAAKLRDQPDEVVKLSNHILDDVADVEKDLDDDDYASLYFKAIQYVVIGSSYYLGGFVEKKYLQSILPSYEKAINISSRLVSDYGKVGMEFVLRNMGDLLNYPAIYHYANLPISDEELEKVDSLFFETLISDFYLLNVHQREIYSKGLYSVSRYQMLRLAQKGGKENLEKIVEHVEWINSNRIFELFGKCFELFPDLEKGRLSIFLTTRAAYTRNLCSSPYNGKPLPPMPLVSSDELLRLGKKVKNKKIKRESTLENDLNFHMHNKDEETALFEQVLSQEDLDDNGILGVLRSVNFDAKGLRKNLDEDELIIIFTRIGFDFSLILFNSDSVDLIKIGKESRNKIIGFFDDYSKELSHSSSVNGFANIINQDLSIKLAAMLFEVAKIFGDYLCENLPSNLTKVRFMCESGFPLFPFQHYNKFEALAQTTTIEASYFPFLRSVSYDSHGSAVNTQTGCFVCGGGYEGLDLATIEASCVFSGKTDVVRLESENFVDFKSEVEKASIVHLIGHGSTDIHNPLNSSLHFSENFYLTVGDIVNELDMGACEIVFLNGCMTGNNSSAFVEYVPVENPLSGLANEVMNLPTAFLLSGARYVVTTLWPVSDVSAFLFAWRFSEILEEGKSIFEAIEGAKCWLRDEIISGEYLMSVVVPRIKKIIGQGNQNKGIEKIMAHARANTNTCPFKEPFHWAGYVVYGR